MAPDNAVENPPSEIGDEPNTQNRRRKWFRPDHLVVVSNIAGLFLVSSLLLGGLLILEKAPEGDPMSLIPAGSNEEWIEMLWDGFPGILLSVFGGILGAVIAWLFTLSFGWVIFLTILFAFVFSEVFLRSFARAIEKLREYPLYALNLGLFFLVIALAIFVFVLVPAIIELGAVGAVVLLAILLFVLTIIALTYIWVAITEFWKRYVKPVLCRWVTTTERIVKSVVNWVWKSVATTYTTWQKVIKKIGKWVEKNIWKEKKVDPCAGLKGLSWTWCKAKGLFWRTVSYLVKVVVYTVVSVVMWIPILVTFLAWVFVRAVEEVVSFIKRTVLVCNGSSRTRPRTVLRRAPSTP